MLLLQRDITKDCTVEHVPESGGNSTLNLLIPFAAGNMSQQDPLQVLVLENNGDKCTRRLFSYKKHTFFFNMKLFSHQASP